MAIFVNVLWALAVLDSNHGITLYRDRQFAAADREFRRVLAKEPKDATTRLYLARTLVEENRLPEALEEVHRALAGQADPNVQFQAGLILRQLAEQRFADLQRVAPNSPAVRELAGRQYERQGRLPEALREYRAAAQDPKRPGVHYRIGNVLWRMRELDSAMEELKAELVLVPHHGMANLRLGQVLLARNEDWQALPYLERAVSAMPDSVEARRELGKAYRKLGRNADARREWEAVAKARPQDDQVHYLLGNLYRQLGEAALAQQELNRHREILERRRVAAERH